MALGDRVNKCFIAFTMGVGMLVAIAVVSIAIFIFAAIICGGYPPATPIVFVVMWIMLATIIINGEEL